MKSYSLISERNLVFLSLSGCKVSIFYFLIYFFIFVQKVLDLAQNFVILLGKEMEKLKGIGESGAASIPFGCLPLLLLTTWMKVSPSLFESLIKGEKSCTF